MERTTNVIFLIPTNQRITIFLYVIKTINILLLKDETPELFED